MFGKMASTPAVSRSRGSWRAGPYKAGTQSDALRDIFIPLLTKGGSGYDATRPEGVTRSEELRTCVCQRRAGGLCRPAVLASPRRRTQNSGERHTAQRPAAYPPESSCPRRSLVSAEGILRVHVLVVFSMTQWPVVRRSREVERELGGPGGNRRYTRGVTEKCKRNQAQETAPQMGERKMRLKERKGTTPEVVAWSTQRRLRREPRRATEQSEHAEEGEVKSGHTEVKALQEESEENPNDLKGFTEPIELTMYNYLDGVGLRRTECLVVAYYPSSADEWRRERPPGRLQTTALPQREIDRGILFLPHSQFASFPQREAPV